MARIETQTISLLSSYRDTHGDKYDYSRFKYVNSETKVEIVCPEHGSFWQNPLSHRICGCLKCAGQGLTLSEKIDKLNKIHNHKYDYSKITSIDNKNKLNIICPIHGEFTQRYSDHKSGNGCQKCGNNHSHSTIEIIEKFNEIHGDKYNYSLVDYKGWNTKVDIICEKHGTFSQTPHNHRRGDKCPKCAGKKLNTSEIVQLFKETHGNKYDYSKVEYKSATSKVIIICPVHGEFLQTPNSHKSGSNCIYCRESKGEARVREYLDNNGIKYIQEYFIPTGNNRVNGHRMDFYLPELNTFIEYQGAQHYTAISKFGGEEGLINRQYKDMDKILTCVFDYDGAEVIDIPFYYYDHIKEYLSYKLKEVMNG